MAAFFFVLKLTYCYVVFFRYLSQSNLKYRNIESRKPRLVVDLGFTNILKFFDNVVAKKNNIFLKNVDFEGNLSFLDFKRI